MSGEYIQLLRASERTRKSMKRDFLARREQGGKRKEGSGTSGAWCLLPRRPICEDTLDLRRSRAYKLCRSGAVIAQKALREAMASGAVLAR